MLKHIGTQAMPSSDFIQGIGALKKLDLFAYKKMLSLR